MFGLFGCEEFKINTDKEARSAAIAECSKFQLIAVYSELKPLLQDMKKFLTKKNFTWEHFSIGEIHCADGTEEVSFYQANNLVDWLLDIDAIGNITISSDYVSMPHYII